MVKKYKVTLWDFIKFGAVYGFITSLLLSLIGLFAISALLPGFLAFGIIVVAGIVLLGVIGGAIGWGINGLVYMLLQNQFYDIAKKLAKFCGFGSILYWQIVLLGLLFTVISNIVGSGGLLNLIVNSAIVLLTSFIIIFISGVFKLKIPLRK